MSALAHKIATNTMTSPNSAWIDTEPCGDPSHKHNIPKVEAVARTVCRLKKEQIFVHVDAHHKRKLIHAKSVTRAMVAEYAAAAEYLVEVDEEAVRQEAAQEEIAKAREAKGKEIERVEEAREAGFEYVLEDDVDMELGGGAWVEVGNEQGGECSEEAQKSGQVDKGLFNKVLSKITMGLF